MSRNLDAPTKAAAEARVLRRVHFVELDYGSNPVRVNSAPRTFSFDSNGDGIEEEFLGVGQLGKMSGIEESTEVKPYTLKFMISGVPQENVANALLEQYQDRPASVWLGLLDEQHRLVARPRLWFRGYMDTQDISLGETAEIEVTAHSRLIDWERAPERHYNDADQRSDYPADRFFKYSAKMVEKPIVWGRG